MIRQVLVIVSLATLLTSCKPFFDNMRDKDLAGDYTGYSLYYGDFSTISDMADIPRYMSQRVSYIFTHNPQSPEYTLHRGAGDCDCYAMLYMDIAYVRFGVKCDLAFCRTGREVIDGGKINHAVVRLPTGKYINAQSGTPYTGSIGYLYSFDEVFGL